MSRIVTPVGLPVEEAGGPADEAGLPEPPSENPASQVNVGHDAAAKLPVLHHGQQAELRKMRKKVAAEAKETGTEEQMAKAGKRKPGRPKGTKCTSKAKGQAKAKAKAKAKAAASKKPTATAKAKAKATMAEARDKPTATAKVKAKATRAEGSGKPTATAKVKAKATTPKRKGNPEVEGAKDAATKEPRISKSRKAEADAGGANPRKARHVQLVSDAEKADLKKQFGHHGQRNSC